MLTQKIDAYHLLSEIHAFNHNEGLPKKLCLTDVLLMLTINKHPDSGKSDYMEILYADRSASKSALDRPMERLMDAGLVEAIENAGARTQAGEGRRRYVLTADAEKLLRGCAK